MTHRQTAVNRTLPKAEEAKKQWHYYHRSGCGGNHNYTIGEKW